MVYMFNIAYLIYCEGLNRSQSWLKNIDYYDLYHTSRGWVRLRFILYETVFLPFSFRF